MASNCIITYTVVNNRGYLEKACTCDDLVSMIGWKQAYDLTQFPNKKDLDEKDIPVVFEKLRSNRDPYEIPMFEEDVAHDICSFVTFIADSLELSIGNLTVRKIVSPCRNFDGESFEKFVGGVSDFWGSRMPMMCVEELGELTQAICKYEREGCLEQFDDYLWRNLVDEMGDVLISVWALAHHYGIAKTDIGKRVKTKMEKKY